jgi:uncharacterized protein YkwD
MIDSPTKQMLKTATSPLRKKIILLPIILLLASCISFDPEPQATAKPDFVTATLAPTKAGFVPATLTPTIEATLETPLISISTGTAPSNCKDAAVLLRDVTIPDDTQVKAGEKFTKTWEFQNTGTCPWTNYTLKFSSGDEINAPPSTSVPVTAPNEKVQVSMELTAPTADGRYTGNFTLNNSNGEVIPIGTEKTFWVKFMVGTYASSNAASGTNTTQSGNCIHSQNVDYVNQVVYLINGERINAGLSALTFSSEIAAFSQSHAEDMAFNNFLSHNGSDGSFGERMAGYSQTHAGSYISGEILAIGTPQNAMDQWRMDEHWDYVLGNFTQIGAGYAYSSCSDYGGYFTVDFN